MDGEILIRNGLAWRRGAGHSAAGVGCDIEAAGAAHTNNTKVRK